MHPITPLGRGDDDGGNPAEHDSDVGNHGQDDDQSADERGEIQAWSRQKRKDGSNENAIDKADKELTAEISNDVAVDLHQHSRDFVFKRRIAKRKVLLPVPLDGRPFLQQEKEIDRHQNETEQETSKAEESANALF